MEDMPTDIMPGKIEDKAHMTLRSVFELQITTAQNETMQTTNASTHQGVLRALEKAGISNDMPIAHIVAKVRTSSLVNDVPALGQLCVEWEKYRQQLFAANSSVLRAVASSIEQNAYDTILSKLTFDNCFTNQLWVNKRIDLREDQFPTMNGDNIDQFIEGIERSTRETSQTLRWNSQAPQLWLEIDGQLGKLFNTCRNQALISRFQNYMSQFWQPVFKRLTSSRDSKIRTIEQMATAGCLPGLSADQSLIGLIDTFKEKWVRLFNKGQCSFAQVQQFIDTETKEVEQLKAANEEALRATDYTKMQHDYTCAFAVHEWLVMTRDLAVECRQAAEENQRLHSDLPQVVRALGLVAPPSAGDSSSSSNSQQVDSKRSSGPGLQPREADKGLQLQPMVAQCQHQELALGGRIGTAQDNLTVINELTAIRKRAFQQAVLLDYATFVWRTIQMLIAHQADYKQSLGAMDRGQAPAASGGNEVKGEVKNDGKAADQDRVYLDEYSRYIKELGEILGLDETDNNRRGSSSSSSQIAGISMETIETLQMRETLQTNASHKLLEQHRAAACQQILEVLRPFDVLQQLATDMQRQLAAIGIKNVLGSKNGLDTLESATQVKGWTNWNIEAKHLQGMPDTAQKLLQYVDHIRRIYPHAFGGMQPQLLHLEQTSLQAASNAAADLGLSFKRVKLMAQPKQTTAIGNMLHNQQKPMHGAGENKDDWVAMTAIQPTQKGSMTVASFLSSMQEWIEIATVCSLFKESNSDKARLQYTFNSNKRKLPLELNLL